MWSQRAVLGKHCPVAPGSPGGQELQLRVPFQVNIRVSLPGLVSSQAHGHSCPWKHFLSVSFSWTWQEESGALITCLGEASFRLTQAKGFVCLGKHLLELVGQFLALAGVLVGMLEVQA